MLEAISHFPMNGAAVSCREIKSGHINQTYLVTTETGDRYILQRVNTYVFPNVDIIMDNVTAIRDYFRENGIASSMITYIDTVEGTSCYRDNEGGCWRFHRFVERSEAGGDTITAELLEKAAFAFGRFLEDLRDFPMERVRETIADFHNTPVRYQQLRNAVRENKAGRAAETRPELDYAFSMESEACRIQKMADEGLIPFRVTHNDTKINNVLFDTETGEAICVIDLDTVMPGFAAYDFGDAIRSGATTAAEGEKDLSKVTISIENYRAAVRGFLKACPSLTDNEVSVLPLGSFAITLECAVRFLADYLNGDVYFHVDYPEHNLVRARCLIKLASEMYRVLPELERITAEEQAAVI